MVILKMRCVITGSKGQSVLLNAVLYFLLIAVIVSAVLFFGLNKIRSLRTVARFNAMKRQMHEIEQTVSRVASGGVGTRERVQVDVDEGTLYVEPDRNQIRYVVVSGQEIISSGRTIKEGEIYLSNNAEVNSYRKGNSVILENEYMYLQLRAVGRENAPEEESFGNLIEDIRNKRLDINLPAPSLSIVISGIENTDHGLIYVRPDPEGFNMGEGQVRISIINATTQDTRISYDVVIKLKSGCDFFNIVVENLYSEAIVS